MPAGSWCLRSLGTAILLAGAVLAHPVSAQTPTPDRTRPTHAVVLTGYGTVGHEHRFGSAADDVAGAFTASFSPTFLYQFQDWVLFEAELEFELEEGATETGLEYAQADVMVADNLTLIGGKFLLPFGVFGERLHPTWINKMATAPPLFGHHGTTFGADPLLSIPSDVGVMARASFEAGRWLLGLNGYVTNGFQEEEHEEVPGEPEEEIPELVLPGSSEDVSNNKQFGGRLDVVLPPFAELNLSAFTGNYDEADQLSMDGLNVAAEVRHGGWELRGEYIRTVQDFEAVDGIADRVRSGLYSQLSYRIDAWEPVLRYTRVFDDETEGVTEDNGASQTAIGLDYWVSPSVAVMASYELNSEDGTELDNDRFNVHLAFGF